MKRVLKATDTEFERNLIDCWHICFLVEYGNDPTKYSRYRIIWHFFSFVNKLQLHFGSCGHIFDVDIILIDYVFSQWEPLLKQVEKEIK